MAKFSPVLTSFNAGEWGPLAHGRIDLPGYRNSTRICENFIPTVQGPVRKRRGFRFISRALGDEEGRKSRLFPYVIQEDEAFMIELVAGAPNVDSIRIFNADGSLGPSFNTTGVPYSAEELFDVQFAQRQDRMLFVHPNHVQHEAFIDENGVFQFLTVGPQPTGPYLPENFDEAITVYYEAGAGALNASQPIFDPLMVPTDATSGDNQVVRLRFIPELTYVDWEVSGEYLLGTLVSSPSVETTGRVNVYRSLTDSDPSGSPVTAGNIRPGHDRGTETDGEILWEWVSSGFVYFIVTGFISTSQVEVEAPSFVPAPQFTTSPGTYRWAFRSFSRVFGWPRTVTFFQQRVIYGGTVTQPQTIWGSLVGDVVDFQLDSIDDDAPFEFTIDSERKNEINFMIGSRRLLVGTGGGEFVINGADEGPITPTSIRIQRDTNYGSRFQQPVQIGESVIFVQIGALTLRDAIYVRDNDGYIGQDLSLLANHISTQGLNHLTWVLEPDQIVWTFDNTLNELVGVTFDSVQKVVAWHRHILGGDTPLIRDVMAIPDEFGATDRLWVQVERTIESEQRTYIEFMDERVEEYVDSYDVAAFVNNTSTSDLSHLEGQEVTVVVDGFQLPQTYLVTAGAITVNFPGTFNTATVGLAYVADMETQTIEGGSQTGVSQGKAKRIHNVSMRVVGTGVGLQVGPDAEHLSPVLLRSDGDNQDEQVPLFTGDTDIVPIESSYDGRAIIYVRHDVALPCIISAMWPQIETYDER